MSPGAAAAEPRVVYLPGRAAERVLDRPSAARAFRVPLPAVAKQAKGRQAAFPSRHVAVRREPRSDLGASVPSVRRPAAIADAADGEHRAAGRRPGAGSAVSRGRASPGVVACGGGGAQPGKGGCLRIRPDSTLPYPCCSEEVSERVDTSNLVLVTRVGAAADRPRERPSGGGAYHGRPTTTCFDREELCPTRSHGPDLVSRGLGGTPQQWGHRGWSWRQEKRRSQCVGREGSTPSARFGSGETPVLR